MSNMSYAFVDSKGTTVSNEGTRRSLRKEDLRDEFHMKEKVTDEAPVVGYLGSWLSLTGAGS